MAHKVILQQLSGTLDALEKNSPRAYKKAEARLWAVLLYVINQNKRHSK